MRSFDFSHRDLTPYEDWMFSMKTPPVHERASN